MASQHVNGCCMCPPSQVTVTQPDASDLNLNTQFSQPFNGGDHGGALREVAAPQIVQLEAEVVNKGIPEFVGQTQGNAGDSIFVEVSQPQFKSVSQPELISISQSDSHSASPSFISSGVPLSQVSNAFPNIQELNTVGGGSTQFGEPVFVDSSQGQVGEPQFVSVSSPQFKGVSEGQTVFTSEPQIVSFGNQEVFDGGSDDGSFISSGSLIGLSENHFDDNSFESQEFVAHSPGASVLPGNLVSSHTPGVPLPLHTNDQSHNAESFQFPQGSSVLPGSLVGQTIGGFSADHSDSIENSFSFHQEPSVLPGNLVGHSTHGQSLVREDRSHTIKSLGFPQNPSVLPGNLVGQLFQGQPHNSESFHLSQNPSSSSFGSGGSVSGSIITAGQPVFVSQPELLESTFSSAVSQDSVGVPLAAASPHVKTPDMGSLPLADSNLFSPSSPSFPPFSGDLEPVNVVQSK